MASSVHKGAVTDICLPTIAMRINMMDLSIGPEHSPAANLAFLVVSHVNDISLQIIKPALRIKWHWLKKICHLGNEKGVSALD